MNTQQIIETAEEKLIHTYNRYQIVLDKGDGVRLYDTDGKEYLDFGAGIAVFALGYNNKEYNDALKAQIKPHFLYNTLDSMKWLGMAHDSPQVATLAANLALLLRASISGDEIVTLEEELELLERYADIQSIRFEDRFTCEIDVSERFQRCLVPKLILQPLVENAVIHALGERDDGYIKVSAEEENGELLLSVTDNGCGMPEALVEAINAGDARRGGGNLGIYNVDSIIKLHFGASYGLTASSTPGEGSRVCIHLPMNRREADA